MHLVIKQELSAKQGAYAKGNHSSLLYSYFALLWLRHHVLFKTFLKCTIYLLSGLPQRV